MLCSLKRGSLPVTFKWIYNNKDVTSSSKYKIVVTDKSSHFSIGNIQYFDIGNYTCVASNKVGVDRKIASIVMEGNFLYFLQFILIIYIHLSQTFF